MNTFVLILKWVVFIMCVSEIANLFLKKKYYLLSLIFLGIVNIPALVYLSTLLVGNYKFNSSIPFILESLKGNSLSNYLYGFSSLIILIVVNFVMIILIKNVFNLISYRQTNNIWEKVVKKVIFPKFKRMGKMDCLEIDNNLLEKIFKNHHYSDFNYGYKTLIMVSWSFLILIIYSLCNIYAFLFFLIVFFFISSNAILIKSIINKNNQFHKQNNK